MNNLKMEKERVKQEELVAKINAMSPEERRKYMARLAIQMRLDSAKMKDLQEERGEINSIPRKKKMQDWQVTAWLLSHGFGGFISGGLISANMPPVDGLVIDDNIGIAMICGALAGGLVGMLNGVMWEERPVSNVVKGIREYISDKRIQKLENKMELDQIVADGVVEMSAQGDYEDMEAYSNY